MSSTRTLNASSCNSSGSAVDQSTQDAWFNAVIQGDDVRIVHLLACAPRVSMRGAVRCVER